MEAGVAPERRAFVGCLFGGAVCAATSAYTPKEGDMNDKDKDEKDKKDKDDKPKPRPIEQPRPFSPR